MHSMIIAPPETTRRSCPLVGPQWSGTAGSWLVRNPRRGRTIERPRSGARDGEAFRCLDWDRRQIYPPRTEMRSRQLALRSGGAVKPGGHMPRAESSSRGNRKTYELSGILRQAKSDRTRGKSVAATDRGHDTDLMSPFT